MGTPLKKCGPPPKKIQDNSKKNWVTPFTDQLILKLVRSDTEIAPLISYHWSYCHKKKKMSVHLMNLKKNIFFSWVGLGGVGGCWFSLITEICNEK